MTKEVFTERVLELRRMLYYVSFSMLHNHADQEDAVQECIHKAQYALDLDVGVALMEELTITRTPFETVVEIGYSPLLRMFSGFQIIPEDGVIRSDMVPYNFGTYHSVHNEKTDVERTTFILPVEASHEDTMALWIKNTDKAVEIDLNTGEVAVVDVQVNSNGVDTQVKR